MGVWRKRLWRWGTRFVLGGLALVVICLLVIWLVLPTRAVQGLIESTVSGWLHDDYGVEITFDSVDVGLVPPRAEVAGIVVMGADGEPMVEVDRARVDLVAESLWAGKVEVDVVDVERPRIRLVIDGGAIINMPELNMPESSNEPTEESGGFEGRVRVSGGEVLVELCDLPEEPLRVRLAGLDVSLDGRPGGRYEARLAVHGGELKRGDARLPVSRIEATATLDEGTLVLPSLEVVLGEASVAVSEVRVGLEAPFDADAQLRATLPLQPVAALFPEVPPLDGALEIDGYVQRRGEVNIAELTLDGRDVTVALASEGGPPLAISAVRGELAYVDGDLLVPRLTVERSGAGGGRVGVRRGSLDLEDPAFPLVASLELDDVELERLLREIGVAGVPVSAGLEGEVAVAGLLQPLGLDVDLDRVDGRDVVVAVEGSDPIVDLEEVRIRGRAVVGPDRARLEEVSVAVGGSTLGVTAEFPFDPSEPSFAVHAAPIDGNFDLVDVSPVASLNLSGHGQVDVRISGVYADPVIDGEVMMTGLVAQGVGLDSVDGRVRYRGGELEIAALTAAVHQSVLRVEHGLVQTGEGGVRVQAVADLEPLDIADALGLAKVGGQAAKVAGRFVGRAEVSYVAATKTASGVVQGELRDVGYDGVALGSGPLDVALAGERLEVRELSLRQGDAEVRVTGVAGTARTSSLEIEANVENFPVKALAPLLPSSAPSVEGRLDVSARVGGTTSSPEVEGRFELNETVLSGRRLEPTALDVTFAGQQVSAHGQVGGELLVLDELTVGLEGDVPLRARAHASHVDFARLLGAGVLPAGTEARIEAFSVDAGVDLSTLANLDGTVSIDGLSGRQGGAAFSAEGPIRARLAGNAIELDPSTIAVVPADGSARGSVALDRLRLETSEGYPVDAHIRLDHLELSHLAPEGSLPEGLTVALSGEAELSGALSRAMDMSVEVTLPEVDVGYSDARITAARPVVLNLAGGTAEARDLRLDVADASGANAGRARIDLFRLGLADPWPVRLRAAVRGLDVAVVAGQERMPEGLDMSLGAVVNVGGDLSQPWDMRGGVVVHDLVATRGEVSISPESRVVARLTNRGVEIERTNLVVTARGRSSRFSLGGVVSPERLDVALAGRVDLSVLTALTDTVEEAEGGLELDCQIGGTIDEPLLVGQGRLDAPRIAVNGMPGPFERIEGVFRFSRSALLIERVGAQLLGGQIRLGGRVDLSGDAQERYHADLIVRDLSWPIGTNSSATVNADIDLDSPTEGETKPLVSGQLEIARLRYRDDLRLGLDINSLLRRRPSTAQTFDPNDASVRLDLRVVGTDDLLVANNVMRASIRFDTDSQPFTVVGTDLVPGVIGVLEIEPEGEVSFRGSRFEIQRGFLTFDRSFEIDPALDVTATTVQRDWTISIVVSGRASAVDVNLRSEPALAREDIILLLAVGMTRAETEEMGYGAAIASLAPELIWGISGFGEDAERFLPLLRSIQVSSEYNTRTGEVEPRVTASWPVNDQFRIGVSGTLDTLQSADGARIGAEYELNDETTIDFNYGTNADTNFGEIGVDVRWLREFGH